MNLNKHIIGVVADCPKPTELKKRSKIPGLMILALYLSVFSSVRVLAQTGTRATAPLTSTGMTGQYYNYSNAEVVLGTGFESTPGSGQSFEAYIYTDPCPPLSSSPSNENYIATFVPRIPGITSNGQLANRSPCDVMQSIAYFDGLGRPLQQVQVNASPMLRDVVQPFVYDSFGREATKYLPYASATANNGSYKTNAVTAQGVFYSGTPDVMSTAYPFAIATLEASPLSRPLVQGAPGADWQVGAHPVKMGYGTNAASDIRLWKVAANGNGAAWGSTYYGAGTLVVDTIFDENTRANVSFKDKQGRVIAKKVQSGSSTWLVTEYVYDDYGNLSYVIPPLRTSYPSAFAESDTLFNRYMYGYHYDSRNRMSEKKVPGKGWDYMVYNKLNQVVATQDSALKADSKWTYTKYDALGRVAITGLYSSSSSRAALQGTLNSETVFWESRGSSYSNAAWPTSSTTALTVNYYDDYNISSIPGAYSLTGASTMTKGLPTASQTGVLGTGDMLWKVMLYDDNGRVGKSYAQHYLGGNASLSTNNYDQVTTTYSFTDQPITSTRTHYKNNGGSASLQLTLRDSLIYDHMGRVTNSWNKINTGSWMVLAQNNYNEIGQIKGKRLHSENSGSSFLQDVAYTYNERGWLNTANTSGGLFNESLGYNSGSSPQWNGNISQMNYGYAAPPSGSATNRIFTYTYDYLNRLTNAALASGTSLNEAMTYDVMGNITYLTRGGVTYGTLGYAYTGNQLTGVTKATGTGFTNRSYSYNANGNATSDGVSKTIDYNLFNLPTTLKVSGSTIATYIYDATGQKLRTSSTADGNWDYIDGINYKAGTLYSVATPEGRITNNGGTYSYQYDLKDHLGNVRVTFDKNPSSGAARIIQQDEYYSFGLRSALYDNSNGNRYLYNGKERQADLTDQYDYGARFYDPVIARWTTVDPLAETMRRWSPYNYGFNNPIRFIDPDGMAPWGDFYGRSGQYLGTDGVKDGKTYLLNAGVRAKTENKNINWGGTLSASASNQLKAHSEEVGGLVIVNRTAEGTDVTTGTFKTSDGSVSGFMAEPAGPATTESGKDKRIPTGVYDVEKRTDGGHVGSYELSNDQVSSDRHILIHSGNTGKDTKGCLLPGGCKVDGGVGQSRDKTKAVTKYIDDHNTKEKPVKVIINENIK